MQPSKEEIVATVKELMADGERIPFISLGVAIERIKRCMVSFRESEEYPGPAICLSEIAQFGYKDQSEWYYIPHHMIFVNPSGTFTQMTRRLGVAHEIGHIVRHFPRRLDAIVDGLFPAEKLGPKGEILYSRDEEVEAHRFAVVLCLCRSQLVRREPVSPAHLKEEIVHALEAYGVEDAFLAPVVEILDELQRTFPEYTPPIDWLTAWLCDARGMFGEGDGAAVSAAVRLLGECCDECRYPTYVTEATNLLLESLGQELLPQGGNSAVEIRHKFEAIQQLMHDAFQVKFDTVRSMKGFFKQLSIQLGKA